MHILFLVNNLLELTVQFSSYLAKYTKNELIHHMYNREKEGKEQSRVRGGWRERWGYREIEGMDGGKNHTMVRGNGVR